MSQPKVCIVDRREPLSRVQQYHYEGFTVEVPDDLVESGDVILCMPSGETIGIEIKTASELLGLVPQGLSNLAQFQRMATFSHRVLLIVGHYSRAQNGNVQTDNWGHRSGIAYASLQGALFNLQANLGFLIRFAGTPDEIGRAVDNIYSYFSTNHVLLAKPRPMTLSMPHASALAVLMTLPGIGQTQADRILKQYGSLSRALLSLADWTSVPGIGPKTLNGIAGFMAKEWYAQQTAA